ncbi:hypothetical protein Tco_1471900 [Tanacetum coccineum]
MDQAGGSYIKNVGIAILDVLLDLANKETNIFKNFMRVEEEEGFIKVGNVKERKLELIKYMLDDDEVFDDIETSSHNLSRYFMDKHDSVVSLLGASRWGTARGDVLRDILTLRTGNLTENANNND